LYFKRNGLSESVVTAGPGFMAGRAQYLVYHSKMMQSLRLFGCAFRALIISGCSTLLSWLTRPSLQPSCFPNQPLSPNRAWQKIGLETRKTTAWLSWAFCCSEVP